MLIRLDDHLEAHLECEFAFRVGLLTVLADLQFGAYLNEGSLRAYGFLYGVVHHL
jgi:hypothetical protein